MSGRRGILDLPVRGTPIAVVDFETTGLYAGTDRVVEVSVVRVEDGREPRLVFDTLVNPRRPMGATFIHGISDRDVEDAPVFEEVAGDFARALSGCVVAAYNVYFDVQFLALELSLAGIDRLPPHLCLMYMRPMLGLGVRSRLKDACRAHGVRLSGAHASANDAMASARLLGLYLDEMRRRGIATFGDLARLRSYKFVRSWHLPPLDESDACHCGRCRRVKSRSGWQPGD